MCVCIHTHIRCCKGAEVAVLPRLSSCPQWCVEELEGLSQNGLRTLVFAYRELSVSQLTNFQHQYGNAKSALIDRDARCNAILDRLLITQLDLLGVTGVEDELQLDVADTLEAMTQAGISVWMLTGDKVETAQCVAMSAGLRGLHDNLVTVTSDVTTHTHIHTLYAHTHA